MTETRIPPEDAMREDWNRRAVEDYRLHIATGHARSDEDFRASGEKDLVEYILNGIELSPDAEALEIGCGVGRLLVPLSTRIATAHGVDISEVMIGRSKEYCAHRPNVSTQTTDGTLGAFAEGSLDFVFSFIVFQHIPLRKAIATYVREASRVLAPGGLLRFQADGRWRERSARAADTYDGVVFSPAEIRAMVEEVGLTVVEEWGQDTHYQWVTAEKPGAGRRRARFRPGHYDTALLRDLLAGVGIAEPAVVARSVSDGRVGVRAALGSFEQAYAGLPNAAFVERVLRELLGREPEPSGLDYHTRILEEGFEDRAAMVDTVLSCAEFRRLVRPRVSQVPWLRLVSLAGPDGVPGFFDAVDATVERIRDLPPGEAVDECFRLLEGHLPDPEGRAYNVGLVERSTFGVRLFVRQFLSYQDGVPAPGPLAGRPRFDLLERLESRGARPAPHTIESFPGEAAAAARFLASSSALGAAEFVDAAHERVIGRPPDDVTHAFYTSGIEGGTLSRAAVLRDLLWSAELRSS